MLIVDRSEEAREVLRTVLQRRGVKTFEAQAPGEGLDLADGGFVVAYRFVRIAGIAQS